MSQVRAQLRSNKRLVVLIVICLIILITIFTVVVLGKLEPDKRSMGEKVIDSFVNTMFVNSSEYTYTLDINNVELEGLEGTENMFIKNVIKDIELEILSKSDQNSDSFELMFDLNMRDVSIIEGQIYGDSEIIGFHIPLVYNQPLYMTWESLKNNYNINRHQSTIDDIKEKMLSKDYDSIEQLDALTYYSIIEQFLMLVLREEVIEETIVIEDRDVETKKYNMQYNLQDLLSVMDELMVAMSQDEQLQSTFGKDFDDEPNCFKEIENIFDLSASSELFIDKDDWIRKSNSSINLHLNKGIGNSMPGGIDLELGLAIKNISFNKAVEFTGFDFSNSVNVSELSYEELNELMLDIEATLNRNLEENQLFQMIGLKDVELF